MPSRRPLWIVLAIAALLGAVFASVAQASATRPADDQIDLAAGPPDPTRAAIEGELAWAFGVLNGRDVSAEELEEHLSPTMRSIVPVPAILAETKRLALDAPYRMHGIDVPGDGVAGALITSRSGDPLALNIAADPSDREGRLTLFSVAPADGVHRGPFPVPDFALHLGAGLALILAGAIVGNVRAGRSRATDATFGLPFAMVGFLWMAQLFELSDDRIFFSVGLVAGPTAAALLTALLVTVASRRRTPSALGVLAILAAAVAATATILSLTSLNTALIGLPDHLLAGEHDGDAARRWSRWGAWSSLVTAGFAIVALLTELMRVTGSRQRGLAPMALGGSAGAIAVAVPALAMINGSNLDLSQSPVISAGGLAAALGVGGSVLWQRYDLDGVATLAATADDGVELGPLLARALGDPTAELLVWDEVVSTYRRPDGTATTAPTDSQLEPGRAITYIATLDRTLGVILHDSAVLDDPDRLDAAKGVAQLSLENDRLYAEVESQLVDVQASRARILEATEEGRRRIERDLHDGAQQHLLSILLSLRLGHERFSGLDPELDGFLGGVTDDLGSAVAQLRELSRGLHPAILDRGIVAAAQSLAETAPLPVTVTAARDDHRCAKPAEHAAYFVMAEALANAARHAEATHLTIDIDCDDDQLRVTVRDDGCGGAAVGNGSGLQNLEDRVLALGGSFDITSPSGAGTRVEVAIPCG